AGACAVRALERVPADIRREGGVARRADPSQVVEIMEAVSRPVMAQCRIGHFVEAQILQALGVDYIDESEVLTPADEEHHVDKWGFTVPFVCGARDLGEALRRIGEGAAMIRTKGEAGTGDIVEAVRHMRKITGQIRAIAGLRGDELATAAKELGAPVAWASRCVGSTRRSSRTRSSCRPAAGERLGVKAGVLALQGDFREHARMLAACGATPVLVRHPEELDDVQALCIPGGESTS